VIHASDGNIPSDMATKTPEEIKEERRLFYLALTRAKDWLYVAHAQRFYHAYRNRLRDDHGYAKRTRFITSAMERHFCCSSPVSRLGEEDLETVVTATRDHVSLGRFISHSAEKWIHWRRLMSLHPPRRLDLCSQSRDPNRTFVTACRAVVGCGSAGLRWEA
jgi:hypothetical protein